MQVSCEREPAGEPVAQAAHAPFISISESQVQSIEVRRRDGIVRCRRIDGRWLVVEPAGSAAPSDLVAGLIGTLTELPDVEVVHHPTDLAQYGLDAPVSQLTLAPMTGASIIVRLGNRNPSGTAVYAQRSLSSSVYLVGLNARYYEDLLFDAVQPTKGPP